MSLSAAAIRLLAEKGLSALDIAEIAEANTPKPDGTRNGNARRQAEFRARKREAEASRNVTDNVTCNVTQSAHSLIEDNSYKNKKESGTRNVTRNVTEKSRRCPEDWVPNQSVYEAGRKRGLTDAQIEREIENIRDTEFPKGHSDWNATARRWMRNTRPDPVPRVALAVVPTQTTADIERRRAADAAWKAEQRALLERQANEAR